MSAPWAPMVAPPLPCEDALWDSCEHGFTMQSHLIDPEHRIQRIAHVFEQDGRPVGEWPADDGRAL